ncbi:MAG: ABC transporter substrate-binding protein [Coleofasciculus sp. S288]|nr:ABC transporter substrate-binding protein [Coleofasciculus sp. S288]
MNKIFLKWVSILLVILSLTACGVRSGDGFTTVTLSGWQSFPAEKELVAQLLKNFEFTHPNIKVKYEIISDQYMDVIKTRLIGDAAPDVFYLDAFEAPLLMDHGVLEPLDNYITTEFNFADFEQSLLKAFKKDGKTYGLPKDFSTLVLFYNKDHFSQANLTVPPKTWKQLREYSKKLTIDTNRDRRPERYGLGIAPELARQYFMIKAFGGRLFDRKGNVAFASRKSLKGLQPIVDQYQNDRSSALPSDVGTNSGSEMFGQGKASMVLEGSWLLLYLQETFPNLEFATAEVPSLGRTKGTMAYTVAYVMNKKAKHKDAAWALISYLTGKEGMEAVAKMAPVLPARKSVLSELGYDRNPLYAPFIKGASYATLWQAGENLPLVRTHFDNQFLSALLGEQSLKSAMKKAQKAANQEIQESRY